LPKGTPFAILLLLFLSLGWRVRKNLNLLHRFGLVCGVNSLVSNPPYSFLTTFSFPVGVVLSPPPQKPSILVLLSPSMTVADSWVLGRSIYVLAFSLRQTRDPPREIPLKNKRTSARSFCFLLHPSAMRRSPFPHIYHAKRRVCEPLSINLVEFA